MLASLCLQARSRRAASAPPLSLGRSRGKRVLIFLTVLPTILLSASWFVWATLEHFLPGTPRGLWPLPPLLSVSFVATTLLGIRYTNPLLRLVYRASALWLGLLNFSFWAACALWVTYLVSNLAGLQVPITQVALACFGLAPTLVLYGVLNAAWPRLTAVTVNLPNLPQAWHGRSAVLVTDLHLGNIRGAAFARRVVRRIQRLHPDVVLIGGDLFDGTTADLDRLVAPWKSLSVPQGVYYVSGNHEEFRERARFLEAVSRTGIRVLNNEKVTVDELQIVGVHDRESRNPQLLSELLRRAQLNPETSSILLTHQPENQNVAEAAGISLQLCGHTHSGQIWPWSRLARQVHGQFMHGLNRYRGLLVFTSCGVGTWGPPLRVGTRPEVVQIHFVRLQASKVHGAQPTLG